MAYETTLRNQTMLSLIDMFTQAGGGNAVNQMAKQFGLSEEQTQAAIDALMPALSMGLKQNATNSANMGKLMQGMMASGQADYFDNIAKAFNPAGVTNGNAILGNLFGSKDMSRAVAAHAAEASGVGQDILKQMLPVLASTMMSGMFKQSTGQMNAVGGAGGNVFGDVIKEMMKQAGQAGGQQAAPSASGNPWGDILKDVLGGGAAQQQSAPSASDNPLGNILKDILGGGGAASQPQAAPTGADNPLGNILKDILGGGAAGQANQQAGNNPLGDILKTILAGGAGGQTSAAPTGADNPLGNILKDILGGGQAGAQADAPAEPQASTPSDNPWGKMFETGKKTQDSYNEGLKTIFDQYLNGMNR
jgi:hypothetical protein